MSEDLTAAWAILAARAEQDVARLTDAYSAGRVSRATFIGTAAARILIANQAAISYSDVAVAAWRMLTTGLPTGALGLLPPPDEAERLIRAMSTVAVHGQAIEQMQMRAARVARSEPFEAGRRALQDALQQRDVKQWRRVVQADACEICSALIGEIHEIETPLRDHQGCRCVLAPVVPITWPERQRAAQHQLRRTWDVPGGQIRLSSGVRIR